VRAAAVAALMLAACGDRSTTAPTPTTIPAAFAVRGRWPAPPRLRYRLEDPPAELAPAAFARAIERAAAAWNATGVVSLQPAAAEDPAPADLVLGFRRGHHGACEPFGPGADVAHAGPLRTPTFVHFDAGRSWCEHDGPGVSLFATALHELGHVLGLGHSSLDTAVMGTGLPRPTTLQRDDLAGLHSLYGGGTDGPGDLRIERRDGSTALTLRAVAPADCCEFTVFDADGDGCSDVLVWRTDGRGHGSLTIHAFGPGPVLSRTIGPFPGAVAAGCDVGCVRTAEGDRLLVTKPPGKTPIARQFDRHGVPELPQRPYAIETLRAAARSRDGDLDGDGVAERVVRRP
jgi:matrix metalloproteinase-8 (neutrophil collagenase)